MKGWDTPRHRAARYRLTFAGYVALCRDDDGRLDVSKLCTLLDERHA